MPPVHFKSVRQHLEVRNRTPGRRALHRGVHYNQNTAQTQQFLSNTAAKRRDHKELLVHHQKVNEALKEVYGRTADLKKDDMTMAERKEESWKAFERIGGVRPEKDRKAKGPLRQNYAGHLAAVAAGKKQLRERLALEEASGGDAALLHRPQLSGAAASAAAASNGRLEPSAHEAARKQRVKKFVKGQISRSRQLRRVGDPTPMKSTGAFDRHNAVLNVHGKAQRRVDRSIKHDARVGSVKERRGGRSMWDARGSADINKPTQNYIKDASGDLRVGRQGRRGGAAGKKRR